MQMLLAGDIGGTKTLLRIAQKTEQGLVTFCEQRYASGDYMTFDHMLGSFLSSVTALLGKLPQLTAACLGIAGPVNDRQSQLTNLGWTLDCDRLAKQLNIEDLSKVSLINDFAAVGYGVLGLQPEDLYTLQSGQVKARSPIAIIGAGTGLGEAFLSWQGDRYEVYATEGGHTNYSPRNALEIELLQYLLERHDRVSVERVVSGTGIVAIYQFLCDKYNLAKELEASAIADAALNNTDPLAVQAMQIFVESYAAEAGNLALKLIPNGGLYIAGGIAPKILPLLEDGKFLNILKSKGRVSPVLADMPVHIVLNPEVGLIGAMLYGASL
ncbi:glucokinase [Pseudanabaena biceps]|nr:glucokinase [Pseudanabaena biceps]